MGHLMPIRDNVVVERLCPLLGAHFFSKSLLARSTKSLKEASDLTCAYAAKYLAHHAIDKLSDSRIIARDSPRADQLLNFLLERSANMDQEVLSQERFNLRVP